MANKKKKFDPYGKPYPPLKPLENITKRSEEKTESYSDSAYITIPDGVVAISIKASEDYDNGTRLDVTFHQKHEYIPNPNFEKENKVYLEKYKAYKAELKEWKAQKKIYDKEEAEKAKKYREAQYLRLKKEFENEA